METETAISDPRFMIGLIITTSDLYTFDKSYKIIT